MSASRRQFLQSGAASAAVAWSAVPTLASAAPEDKKPDPARIDGLTVLDYGRSFVGGTAAFNNVRFWVESRTVLKEGDQTHEFWQFGACKSENTFAEKDLFQGDNYDFTPILANDGWWLIFRRRNRLTPEYRGLRREVWGPARFMLREAVRVQVLTDFAQIEAATAEGRPLVSRTELTDPQSGRSAVIEAPVKTINIHPEKKLYQIDTGPVALPDLARSYEPPIDCLRLAFVAFNRADFADFVVEQPTPILIDQKEQAQVLHYANPISFAAKNSLLAILD